MSASDTIALHASGLTRSFGGFMAVGGVDFSLRRGERRALIGPNGAGKSTLISMLAGELVPSGGNIYLGGRDVTRMRPALRARQGLGRTFQITQTFLHLTVLQNMLSACVARHNQGLGLSRALLKRLEGPALEALAVVGLDAMADRPVSSLALSDRKRLEFGMALVSEPTVLLLDEPTAGMGLEERYALMDLVAARAERLGITLLFVEHDIDVVFKTAHLITVMVRGRVFAEGTPEQIASNQDVQEIYLGGGGH